MRRAGEILSLWNKNLTKPIIYGGALPLQYIMAQTLQVKGFLPAIWLVRFSIAQMYNMGIS